MKKITALILFSFIKWFFLILLSFCVVFAVGELFDLMKYLSGIQAPAKTLFFYFLFKIPYFLNLTIPLSALLAVFITIGNFKKTSELKAMRALGISNIKIFLPIMFICALAVFFNFINLQYLMPSYYLRSHYIKERELRQNINAEILPRQAEEILFWVTDKSVLFIEKLNFSSNKAENINFSQIDENYNLQSLTLAPTGEFEQSGGLLLFDAVKYSVVESDKISQNIETFKIDNINLRIIKHIFINASINYDFLSLSDQYNTWQVLKLNMFDWKDAAVNFLTKVSFALAPLFLFFFAARFLIYFPHSNTFLAIGISIAYSFFYWILTNVSSALSLNTLPYALGPFLNNIFTLFAALFLSKADGLYFFIKK